MSPASTSFFTLHLLLSITLLIAQSTSPPNPYSTNPTDDPLYCANESDCSYKSGCTGDALCCCQEDPNGPNLNRCLLLNCSDSADKQYCQNKNMACASDGKCVCSDKKHYKYRYDQQKCVRVVCSGDKCDGHNWTLPSETPDLQEETTKPYSTAEPSTQLFDPAIYGIVLAGVMITVLAVYIIYACLEETQENVSEAASRMLTASSMPGAKSSLVS